MSKKRIKLRQRLCEILGMDNRIEELTKFIQGSYRRRVRK